MPLEKLTTSNFQKHKKLTVEFDPGVTTIVGASKAGKSCLLRALRLLCLNQPRGRSFVRNRKGVTSVAGRFEGVLVKRRVGKGTNTYHLHNKRYVSFGTGKVPEPVERVLRVCPVNFQRQLDSVFLFSETPGQISRSLNEVINLGLIDEVLAALAQEVRQAENRHKSAVTDRDEAKEACGELSFVDDLAADFKALTQAFDAHAKASHRNARAERRLRRAAELRQRQWTLAQAKGDADELIAAGERLRRVRLEKSRLQKVVDSARELAGLKTFLKDADALSAFREKADKVAEDNRESYRLIEEAKLLRRRVKCLRADLESNQSRLAKATKGQCPLCGASLKKSF